jgi:hypothetical protein
VAKKRKTSRKPAPRKKKTAPKKTRRVSEPLVSMKGTKVDLRPFKKRIKAHIDKLKAAKSPEPQVALAIDTLSRSLDELNDECLPTMELELG